MFPIWTMDKPLAYGWFHMAFIISSFFTLFIMLIYFSKIDKKALRKVIIFFAVLTTTLELYKQIYLLVNFDFYDFDNFPFHFCSLIIYATLVITFSKNEKVHEWTYDFIALYCTTAGLAVLLFPGGIFTQNVLLNLHTMMWHASLTVVSLFVLLTRIMKKTIVSYIRGTTIFIILCFIALGLNYFTYHVRFLPNNQYTWFFFIGPYAFHSHPASQWALSFGGWQIYIVIYLLIFMLMALSMLIIHTIYFKIRKKIQNTSI